MRPCLHTDTQLQLLRSLTCCLSGKGDFMSFSCRLIAKMDSEQKKKSSGNDQVTTKQELKQHLCHVFLCHVFFTVEHDLLFVFHLQTETSESWSGGASSPDVSQKHEAGLDLPSSGGAGKGSDILGGVRAGREENEELRL